MCRSGPDGRRCPSHSNPAKRRERNAVRRANDAVRKGKSLSDAQYSHRIEYAYEAVQGRVEGRQETHYLFARETVNGALVWDAERVEKHNEIIAELLDGWKDVPNGGEAYFSGGLGGAGKSTVLRGPANIDQSQYATLNPDDVKEIMAEKGLVPNIPGLSPMEASPLVHEEASDITKRVAAILIKQKKNIIYDVTMGSYGSTVKKVEELEGAGYSISAVFVDIPPSVSLSRSQKRHREGVDAFLAGEGQGGRLLPKSIIENQVKVGSKPGESETINMDVFLRLKDEGKFTDWSVWDNGRDGEAPVLKERK